MSGWQLVKKGETNIVLNYFLTSNY